MNDDEPCGVAWKDPDGTRTHYCMGRGPHDCYCGVCGPDCTPGKGCDMTTETLTLTDFLLARIAEDEAAALAASLGPWGHDPSKEWHVDPAMLERARAAKLTYDGEEFVRGALGGCIAVTGPSDDAQSMADAAHIARHDPARVLAECAAKRAIVERLADGMALFNHLRETQNPHDADDYTYGAEWGLDFALRHLAAVYADHDDYRDEWKP